MNITIDTSRQTFLTAVPHETLPFVILGINIPVIDEDSDSDDEAFWQVFVGFSEEQINSFKKNLTEAITQAKDWHQNGIQPFGGEQ